MQGFVYPATSAIITAYNSADYIGDAIESVRHQTIRPAEIIVVDDGSTDRTQALVRALGADIRYIHQDNRGEASARNHGIALARGEAIAFLDADDAWPPNRLATLLARLTEKDSLSIVCGRARAFRNEAWTDALSSSPERPEAFLMSFGCALIRREVFSLIGKADVTMHHGVDLDWFLRCREHKVPIATIDDIVLLYRRHGQNMTQNFAAGREGLMRTVKQSLDRRRRNSTVVESLASWESLGRGNEGFMALISVIIPVFNCERYVAAAIDSVLQQTMMPNEIIVVDDGSTDTTPSVLGALSPPVTLIRQPNRGGAIASNRGVAAATGRFLCFLDADDLWIQDKVARQFDRLTRYPDKEAVFGHVQQFISDDLAPNLAQRVDCPQAPQPGISKISMMIRREAFDRIGPFDSTLRNIDFLEWYTRAIEKGLQVDMLPEVVALRRLHATNNGTARRDAQRSENLEALKRALDRRRSTSHSRLSS